MNDEMRERMRSMSRKDDRRHNSCRVWEKAEVDHGQQGPKPDAKNVQSLQKFKLLPAIDEDPRSTTAGILKRVSA